MSRLDRFRFSKMAAKIQNGRQRKYNMCLAVEVTDGQMMYQIKGV